MLIDVTEEYCISLSKVYQGIVVNAEHASTHICERDGIIECRTLTHIVRIQNEHVEVVKTK